MQDFYNSKKIVARIIVSNSRKMSKKIHLSGFATFRPHNNFPYFPLPAKRRLKIAFLKISFAYFRVNKLHPTTNSDKQVKK